MSIPKDRIPDLHALLMAIRSFGWEIAIPHGDDDSPVIGMVIGTPQYVEWITSGRFLAPGSKAPNEVHQ